MNEIDSTLIYGEWTYDYVGFMQSAIGEYEESKVLVFNYGFGSLELYPTGYKTSKKERSISYSLVTVTDDEYDILAKYNNRYIEYIGDHHLCVGGDICTRRGLYPNASKSGMFVNNVVLKTWAMIPEIKKRNQIGYFIERKNV